jgi:hypothetical protein
LCTKLFFTPWKKEVDALVEKEETVDTESGK